MPKRPKNKPENSDQGMPLSEHLRELRNRVLVCVAALLISTLAGLRFAPDIVDLLLDIGRGYNYSFVFIAPQELLMQYVSTALICGLCVTIPVLFYEVWAFIQSGLKPGEKQLFILAMVFGLVCFCVGVYFAYRIMLPFMLYFLIGLSGGSTISAAISVQNYISFLTTIFLVFGALFELPVLSVLLNRMGILKVEWMRKGRRVMIVVIFIVGALVTPPDIVSQIMVALPMLALYEFSILLCAISEKFKRKAAKEKEQEEEAEEEEEPEEQEEEKETEP